MAKEFVYTKVQDLGKIGDKTVEIGHYIVDGKVMPDKVYMVNYFTTKDGNKYSKVTAICAIGEAKEIGKILMEIEVNMKNELIKKLFDIAIKRYEKEYPNRKITTEFMDQIYFSIYGVLNNEGKEAAIKYVKNGKLW